MDRWSVRFFKTLFVVNKKNVQITFDVKGDEVTEHHKRVGNPDVSPETYHYTISEDNSELIMVSRVRR